jgi:hypothetical protein
VEVTGVSDAQEAAHLLCAHQLDCKAADGYDYRGGWGDVGNSTEGALGSLIGQVMRARAELPWREAGMSGRQQCQHQLQTRMARQSLVGDIQEHRALLTSLAKRCNHITEMGVRDGVSTVAFLSAEPRTLVAYDLKLVDMLYQLQREVQGCGTNMLLVEGDDLQVTIEPTDLLFIDTLHTGEQLRQELERHSANVRRYLVMHDTSVCAYNKNLPDGAWRSFCGEQSRQVEGLQPVIDEFLRGLRCGDGQHWRLVSRNHNNNGLTVLRRRRSQKQKQKRRWYQKRNSRTYK